MGRGKAKRKDDDVLKTQRKLLISDKYVVIALKMMFVEIGGLNLNNKQKVAEWYYSLYKSADFKGTTFGSKDADPKAHRFADSFRVSFLKQLQDQQFTIEFLTKVVLGLRIFGPFAGWEEFTSFVSNTFDGYVETHEDIYQQVCEQAEIVGFEISRELVFPWHYVDYVYDVEILLNKVVVVIGDEEPRHLAAQSYNRTVFYAQDAYEINNLEIYDHAIANFPRAINFEKDLLAKKSNGLFYYTVGVFPRLMLDSISIIPMNSFGHWQLRYGKLFFKKITPNMVCALNDHKSIDCIYVECSTGIAGIGVLTEFSHYIGTLITRIIGPDVFNTPIYIANDSPQKQEIILRYGFERTDIEAEIDFIHEYEKGDRRALARYRVKYCLYQIKLYKLMFMKYSLGQTSFSID